MSGLQEFKNETFRGRYLTVSVARENFMEKLKREREESTQSPKTDVSTRADVSPKLNVSTNPFRVDVKKNAKVLRTFSSDDEETNRSFTSQDSAFAEPESVIKRKSKLFTENGKVSENCLLVLKE